MANLNIRNIDDNLYELLRNLASYQKRSISEEVVYILKNYLSSPKSPKRFEQNSTEEFLKLADSWEDDRTAEEIISDIRQNRRSFTRFRNSNELFD